MRTTQALLLVAFLLSPISKLPASQIPDSWRDDAELRDIHFVDADYGWAVGDHGTIWHTQNGGEIWRPQTSAAECQLNTVFFVDRKIGYAAGGNVIPVTHRSVAVFMRTTDGGRTWQETGGLLLPMLTQIHFTDAKRGYAVGMSSAIHPSGAWATRDAGRTWSPLPGVTGEHWDSADFLVRDGDKTSGPLATPALLLSKSGARAWLTQDRLIHAKAGTSKDPIRNDVFGSIVARSVAFAGSTFPEVTGDSGNSWQALASMRDFPRVWEDGFEARTMAAVKGQVWVAGSPGARILRSSDMGTSWQAVTTPVTFPIRRLHFLDADHGWAVGACGMILSTKDGGATWKQQRGGAKRMALVGLFATESDVPWDMLTQVSAQHAYRIHVVVLASRSNADLRCEAESRLEAAASQIGASAEILTRLPLKNGVDRPLNELLSDWQQHDGNVIEKTLGRLTRLLRVYRPDVVVTSHSLQSNDTTLSPTGAQQLLSRLLLDSVEYAASSEINTKQLQLLGLQPWSVAKTLVVQPTDGRPIQMDSVASVLGTSVGDLSRRAHRLVDSSHVDTRRKKAWSLFTLEANANIEATDIGRHPLSSTSIQYDSAQRRPRTIRSINLTKQKTSLQRLTQTRRIVSSEKVVGRGIQRIEQIERLLGEEPQILGDVLFELSQSELANGNDGEAATILQHLASSHREHPLAERAMQWLMAYHSSVERMWRDKDKPSSAKLSPVTQTPILSRIPTIPKAIRLASADLPFEPDEGESATSDPVEDAAANTDAATDLQSQPPAEATIEPPFSADMSACFKLAREIKSKRPVLYSEPAVLFPLASASWIDGQTKAAKSFYQRQTSLPDNSVWRNRAIRELRLSGVVKDGTIENQRRTNSNASSASEATVTWSCNYIKTRPNLDGKLDDDCWQPDMVLELQNEFGLPTTQVVLAQDAEYLYVAAACPKRAKTTYLPKRRPRPRDADLSKLDRLRISIDINRDYASCWTIEIDHRGWTNDALQFDLSTDNDGLPKLSRSDATWNPDYFVASDANDKSWTIEAAIPLDQLAPAEYRNSVWAVGVERVVPEVVVERPSVSTTSSAVSGESSVLQGVIQLESRKISP